MMYDVEERLREALRRHADDSPTGSTMLTTVTATSARARRRARLATLASGLGAVLVVGGVAVVAGTDPTGPTPPLPVAAAPSRPPTSDALKPAAPMNLVFPYTATPLTSGDEVQAMLVGGVLQLLVGGGVTVETAPVQPQPAPPGTPAQPGQARGHTAVVRQWDADGGHHTLLTWPETPNQWIAVQGADTVTATQLGTVAQSLVPAAVRVKVPFTFDLVPATSTVDNLAPSAVTFCPPGVNPGAAWIGKVAVMLDGNARGPGNPADHPVKVGGRDGVITNGPGARSLAVPRDDGTTLIVQDTTAHPMSDADLVRFAAGIHVTADAQAGQG
jgi:hypothetical protein